MYDNSETSTKLSKMEGQTKKDNDACANCPNHSQSEMTGNIQEYVYALSDNVQDVVSLVYTMAMAVMFQARSTDDRDKMFLIYIEAMKYYINMMKHHNQLNEFTSVAEMRCNHHIQMLVDAYRSMEGQPPPFVTLTSRSDNSESSSNSAPPNSTPAAASAPATKAAPRPRAKKTTTTSKKQAATTQEAPTPTA